MSTAQDPPVRNKQKRRRTKQLAQWRAKQAANPAEVKGAEAKSAAAGEPAAKAPAKKAPAAAASTPAKKPAN